jgi:WD40 repeat protein
MVCWLSLNDDNRNALIDYLNITDLSKATSIEYRPLVNDSFEIREAFFSGDNDSVIILYDDFSAYEKLIVYDLATGKEQKRLVEDIEPTLRGIAFTNSRQKGIYCVVGEDYGPVSGPLSFASELTLVYVKSGRKKVIIKTIDGDLRIRIHSPSISDDGKKALTYCGQYSLSLWDLSNHRVKLFHKPTEVSALKLSPRGDSALIGCNNLLLVWNISNSTVT